MVQRVALTEQASDLLRRLTQEHGPLMFHQSGGCCDGSAPMCYLAGEFIVGDSDVLLGLLPSGVTTDVPFYISRAQFQLWKHTHLTVDVVSGRGSGFSLEAPYGVRFMIRSRLFSDSETAVLAKTVPPGGFTDEIHDLPGEPRGSTAGPATGSRTENP